MTMSMGVCPDDSFKRPGAVPFKWESQPGVPKHASPTPSPSPRPKLHPPPSRARHPARYPRSASASPTRCRPSPARGTPPSPSSSPSWKLPTAAVVSHGCFPAGSPLKRRDERRKANKGSPEATGPRRAPPTRSASAFSAPLSRSPLVAEEAAGTRPRRSSLAFSAPLGRSSRMAEEDWTRRASPAFLSPLSRYPRAAEEAVSATRWLF